MSNALTSLTGNKKYPEVLSTDEELKLFRQIQTVEGKKRDFLIEKAVIHNMRLVIYIALQYKGRGVELSDLIQEGSIGLMKAIEKFDPERGVRFSTYSTWSIKQYCTTAIYKQAKTIRLSSNVIIDINHIKTYIQNFQKYQRRKPTNTEIANELRMGEEKVKRLMEVMRNEYMPSLDEPINEKGLTLMDTIKGDSENTVIKTIDIIRKQNEIMKAINTALTEREKGVIMLRFGITESGAVIEEMTLAAIGKQIGITRQGVEQTVKRALQKLLRYNSLREGRLREILLTSQSA